MANLLAPPKAKEHDEIQALADSKLNTITEFASTARIDGKISDQEFRLVLSEVSKQHEMKGEIRSRTQKAHAAVVLDEETKDSLVQMGYRRGLVVWSSNEKTAYMRNQAMQTRLNTIMDSIAAQQETSRKTLRYEAHKFRKKNDKYYCHPSACVDPTSAVNIAPPSWKPSSEVFTERINDDKSCSDIENDEVGEISIVEESQRKKGIITRARKPVVKFTKIEQEYQIEDDLQIDDFDATSLADEKYIKTVERMPTKVRSLSAVQSRESLSPREQQGLRHQSAFPALRNQQAIELETDDCRTKSRYINMKAKNTEQFEKRTQCVAQEHSSSNFFDKSKAAYMLRQDLRMRAKMRKQSVKPFVFTLQDALNLEREKFLKTRENIAVYIKRIERIKCVEAYSKWTKDEI